jgi:hypothetical protein
LGSWADGKALSLLNYPSSDLVLSVFSVVSFSFYGFRITSSKPISKQNIQYKGRLPKETSNINNQENIKSQNKQTYRDPLASAQRGQWEKNVFYEGIISRDILAGKYLSIHIFLVLMVLFI